MLLITGLRLQRLLTTGLSEAIPTHQRSSAVRLPTPFYGPDSHPPHHLPHYILLRCGCFFQILFVSIRDAWLFRPDHIRLNCRRLLGLKNQGSTPPPPPPPSYVSSVCKAFMKIYFNYYVFILPSNSNAFL